MERIEIEAVYENRTLKLPRDLPLQPGQKVTIIIHPTGSAAERLYGIIPWRGSHEELENWLNDPDEGQWGSRDG